MSAKEAAAAAAAANDPTVSAQTTEEALAAAVAASASAASQKLGLTTPTDRDVILGEGSAGHKTNLLLQDIIRLHRILWKLHDKAPPKSQKDVEEMARHIMELIKNGKSFELAGLKDVPKQFMKSKGRFFGKDAASKAWVVMPDEEVKNTMCEIILDDFKVDDLGKLEESPYKDLKEWIGKKQEKKSTLMPEGHDAILLPCEDLLEKMYEHQGGNKTLFNLASQNVTSYTNTPEKRVEAALNLMKVILNTFAVLQYCSRV